MSKSATLCSVRGCRRTRYARTWCAQHYDRWHNTGSTGKGAIAVRAAAPSACSVTGCEHKPIAKGLCSTHYQRQKKTGDPLGLRERYRPPAAPDTCTAPACDRRYYAGGYCQTHFKRVQRGERDALTRPIPVVGNGHVTKSGYRVISRPGHPNAAKTGAIFEHRLLMSDALGRPLAPGENAHHRNGNRADNTIGPCFAKRECDCPGDARHNLELWSTSQPSGQRVADKVAWARELLALYGDLVPED